MNFNRVMLGGRLTRDPGLTYLQNNTPVCEFGIAINRKWKNQGGEQQEKTTFVDCTAFARTAEVINEHFRKGRAIFVEGRLDLDQWQDKEGNKRSKLKVVVESFDFIDSKSDQGGEQATAHPAPSRTSPTPPRRPQATQPNLSAGGGPHVPLDESDIPFSPDSHHDNW